MSNESQGMLIMVVVAIFFIIALLGLLKPVFQRFSGRKEQLIKQEEANAELRRQNELLTQLVKKEKEG